MLDIFYVAFYAMQLIFLMGNRNTEIEFANNIFLC